MYSVCIYRYIVKIVSYYELSVLSMSMMGFQKKKSFKRGGGGGWVG